MATKTLGKAKYSAYRLAGVTTLTAAGETPNLNDKVDFEELPFTVSPPMFGFFVTTPDIALPAVKPFKYEEVIAYPLSASTVQVQDKDGFQTVPIAEVVIPPINVVAATFDDTATYCVFQWIGINPMMIAKCDAKVSGHHAKVFGPDTHAACEKYIADHGGIST